MVSTATIFAKVGAALRCAAWRVHAAHEARGFRGAAKRSAAKIMRA
jgi:hypothetical protein